MEEDKNLQDEAALRTVPSGPHPETKNHQRPDTGPHPHESKPRTETKLQPNLTSDRTMHCGFIFFLFPALWAELVAGWRVPVRRSLKSTDPDMQSIIHSLQEALKIYSNDLKQVSILTSLPTLPCTETAAQLEQSSTVASRLSQYQMCAEQLRSLSADNRDLCNVVRLNNDLLQHLEGPYQESADCASLSLLPASAPLTDFDTLLKSVQCVHCWILQVEALRR